MVLQTVGEVLRTEREKQGLSVKDIEKATSIRALYIQAIEDGNYSVLPGEVYLKGFIRNYASFLGINPQNMMELYRQNQSPQPAAPQTPVAATPAAPSPAAPSPAAPASAPSTSAPTRTDRKPEKSGGSSTKWVVIGLVVLLLGGGAWAAMEFLGQTPEQPKVPQTPPKTAQPAPAPAPTPTPAPAPATPQKPPAQAKPIVVVAKFTAECWTQAFADGKEVYEGIPKVGETLTWNADKNLTIHVGNAAGIDLTYNGKPQGKLGGDGDVITKTFSANTTNTP